MRREVYGTYNLKPKLYWRSLRLAKRPFYFSYSKYEVIYIYSCPFTFQTSIVTTRRVLERIVVRHVSQRTAWKLLKGNKASLIFSSVPTCGIWWVFLVFQSTVLCIRLTPALYQYHHVGNFNVLLQKSITMNLSNNHPTGLKKNLWTTCTLTF